MKNILLKLSLFSLFYFVFPVSSYPQIPADTLKIDSLLNVAYELEQNYPDSAIAIYERSGKMANEINDPLREGQSHHYRALVMFEKGDYDKALAHYNIAMEFYEVAGYLTGIASLHTNMGNIWLLAGDYDKAVELYFKALESFKSLNDTLRLMLSYMNIGSLFHKNQHYSDGLRYNQLALQLAIGLKDIPTLAEIHHNISLDYYKLDSIDSFFYHMQKARNFAIESGHMYAEMLTYNSHLEYHIDRQNPDSALYYARLNIDAAQRFGNPYNLTGTYNMAASAYILANRNQRALELLQKALSIGEENNFLPMLAWSNESLAKVYAELRDYQRAYSHATALNALKDSVFKMEQQEKILSMDRKFNVAQTQSQLEQKQLTLQLQDQKIKRNNALIIFTGLFSLLALVAIFLLYKFLKNKSKLASKELEKEKLQREKHMIKALMEGEEKERRRIARELHDGVNGNLAVLKLSLDGIKNNEFSGLLEQTMVEIRDLSHNLIPDVVKRSGLKNALEQYILNIRGSSDIQIEFQFFGNEHPVSEEIRVHIYRMVQELISNSLKHAEGQKILVQIMVNDDAVSITVEDDGKGFEINPKEGLPETSEGIGLSGIENRVTYLQGNFDIHSSTHSGTSVHIEIPLITKAVL